MAELLRPSQEDYKQTDKLPLVVVLDNVRSMHNVGSVFRSADAFGVAHIYLLGFTPRPPHRDIQKTALGATETVSWSGHDDAAVLLQQLKQDQFRLLAIEQCSESQPLHKMAWDRAQPLALVFGNEVDGVSDEVLSACDAAAEITQFGTKNSLNIAVAAGIVMHHFVLNQPS